MIDTGQAIIGIIVLLVVVGALLYVFYTRTNSVEKTGYGALIMLAVISLMIPVFWIMETNGQAMAKAQQHTTDLQRGAGLYGQYCFQCHGTKGQGYVGPKLNTAAGAKGQPTSVNNLSDADLLRIISAGVYKNDTPSNLDKAIMPAWSQNYGGPLTDDDIQYLFQLVRSADPTYLAANGYASDNGFNKYLLPFFNLTDTNKNAYGTAVAKESTGQFGSAADMTTSPAVTIQIGPPPAGATCAPACYLTLNIKIKVGTKITWDNIDSLAHTVTAIKGTSIATLAPTGTFDSKNLPAGQKYSHVVTMDDYNLNPDHTVIYYCQYHASMVAELTIVP